MSTKNLIDDYLKDISRADADYWMKKVREDYTRNLYSNEYKAIWFDEAPKVNADSIRYSLMYGNQTSKRKGWDMGTTGTEAKQIKNTTYYITTVENGYSLAHNCKTYVFEEFESLSKWLKAQEKERKSE